MSLSFNIIGTYSLYKKEVKRFLKVYNQTVLAPVITAILFLAIFQLAVGKRVATVGEVPFAHFMAAGLIIMSSMQNAFANTSSALTMGKVIGTIIDYLLPPLEWFEILLALTLAAVTRAMIVACCVALALSFFLDITIAHPLNLLFFLVFGSMALALLGILGGILAETFDQISAITSYVITPLTFLSGTFYSVHALPKFWYLISQFNPFFYIIDGFRYGMTGYHDSNIAGAMVVVLATNAALVGLTGWLLFKGYRIKA